MERLGIILDVTHLSDESLDESMDIFGGAVWASHCNCRALVPGDRQLSDRQLKRVIERGGVIGAAFDAWMLIPGWERGVTTPEASGVALSHVVLPATPTTPALAPTSTAASGASNRRAISTRSPICRSCPAYLANAAIRRRTSKKS